MRAKDLIAILEKHPEQHVVLSKDGEGNSFSPLVEVDEGIYEPHNTWSGEVRDVEEGETEPKVFVLWPTN